MEEKLNISSTGIALGDPRLERLLEMAREKNELLAKIQAASNFLKSSPSREEEAVSMARDELYRDLGRQSSEARGLLPVVDEIVSQLEDQEKALDSRRKINLGLAKIEGMTGDEKQKAFEAEALDLRNKIAETQSLIRALDAIEQDVVGARGSPLACPRCSSTKITYRIGQSETGFTIYKCSDCSNAWKITEYKLRFGTTHSD